MELFVLQIYGKCTSFNVLKAIDNKVVMGGNALFSDSLPKGTLSGIFLGSLGSITEYLEGGITLRLLKTVFSDAKIVGFHVSKKRPSQICLGVLFLFLLVHRTFLEALGICFNLMKLA